jgi:hypothetical protein
MTWASASVDGRVAVELFEQGVAAIGNAAADNAEGAAFTDGRADFPIGVNAHRPDLAQPCGGEFTDGFEKVSSDAGRGC